MKITWATLTIVNAIYYLANVLTGHMLAANIILIIIAVCMGLTAYHESREKDTHEVSHTN